MYGTVFSNPHGLDEETENYSTAMDMAKLASYSYKKLPLYREITGTYKYSLKTNKKSYTWYNRNKLLKKYKYCVGGKTGYTEKETVEKRECLVLFFGDCSVMAVEKEGKKRTQKANCC